MSTETREKLLFVCKGTRIGRDGKPFIVLARIELPTSRHTQADGGFRVSKDTKKLRAGQVYSIDAFDAGQRIVPASAKWVGEFYGQQEVIEWQAETSAADLQLREKARAKRFEDFYRVRQAIEPLRLSYQRLAAPDRLPFELWLLNELRKK